MLGSGHSMRRRRVSTGHKGDGGRSLFSRFLAAAATHWYAFRLTPSRRRPLQFSEIRGLASLRGANRATSALGQKRTSKSICIDVRFGPTADLSAKVPRLFAYR